MAPLVDALIVVGSSNSSNSQRLREVAERVGCPITRLVNRAEDLDWDAFSNIRRLGLTAGASAPEVLVEEIIDAFATRYEVTVDTVSTTTEDMVFRCRASCAARRRSRVGHSSWSGVCRMSALPSPEWERGRG